MKEPTFEIIAGIIGLAFGSWILYGSFRPVLPRWLHAWWLSENMPSRIRIRIERTLAVVVGFGSVCIGVLMILGGAIR
jgi:hypothetical protein